MHKKFFCTILPTLPTIYIIYIPKVLLKATQVSNSLFTNQNRRYIIPVSSSLEIKMNTNFTNNYAYYYYYCYSNIKE